MIHRLQQLGKYFYHGVDFTKDLMGNYWSFLEGHIPCLGGTVALVLMIITIVLVISLLMAVSKKFANSVDDEYFVRIQEMDLTAMPRKVFLYVLYAYLFSVILWMTLVWFCEEGTIDGLTALSVVIPYVGFAIYWVYRYFAAYTAKEMIGHLGSLLKTQVALFLAFSAGLIGFVAVAATYVVGIIFGLIVIVTVFGAGCGAGKSDQKGWIVVLVPWK